MTDCCVCTYNLCINQGATFSTVFFWNADCGCTVGPSGTVTMPIDLTGYSAAMQIRPFPTATTIFYDASSNITLGGIYGTITLIIPAANTATFTWWQGMYDIVLTSSGGQVTRLIQGNVSISPGVTQ